MTPTWSPPSWTAGDPGADLPLHHAPPMVVPTLGHHDASFMGSWNSYLWPLIVLTSTDKQTLQVVLGNMNGMYKTTNMC